MASDKKYWQSVEELKGSSIVETLSKNEFVEEIPTDQFLGDKETLENSSTSRRDFLKYVGFTTAAASLAACEGPVKKSIPYVVKPDDITLGVADWYATSMADGYDFANVLVKTREGRPIQIMPNKEANGTTSARVQAAVLSLYDAELRLKEPTKGGEIISWADADKEIVSKLNELKEANKSVVLLTGSMASPSTDKVIEGFIAANPNAKHVVYDAVSESGAADAFKAMYGKRALPNYHLDKAKAIVSFGADFLGDFHGGLEKAYVAGRKSETGHMSYHVQIESNMSLTGANSDKRVVVKPSDQVFALLNLYNAITGANAPSKATPIDVEIKKLASVLKKAGSKGVVLSGLNDKNAQLVTLAINKELNSEIIDVNNTLNIRQGNDAEVAQLVSDMKAGKVAGLISYNVDPVYSLSNSSDFSEGLKKLELSVALSTENNDTVNASNFALPTPHFLESWGDTQFDSVTYGLMQPTIQPLFNTRQVQDTLLSWSGNATKYYDYLKSYATSNVLGGSSWNKALHNGFFTKEVVISETNLVEVSVLDAASKLSSSAKKSSDFELNLYTKTGLGDGKQANNPWLQELPDPITRASWDNYLMMSMPDARELGFSNPVKDNGAIDGDYAKVSVNGKEVVVPVMIQPGQAKGSVGLALGYGKTFGLKEEMQVGVNAYPLYTNGNNIQYGVTIEKISGTHKFACTQVQKTIAGRHDILKEASLKEVISNADPKHSWNKPSFVSYDHNEVEAKSIDLWDEHNREVGHHFNLSIDLTSCTGCGACVVACHAENNVPVVGKKEVRVGRDMHWLRIDRYYSSRVDDKQKDAKMTMAEFKAQNPNIGNKDLERKYTEKVLELSGGDLFDALENSAENPEVSFQPMMCQHCNHAPCETVCPVAATSHGRQGQNQMAYNRCVGTRYCANNCPYRVRRFNWFNYSNNKEFDFNMNNEYGKMVLNPDVVVRSRGVMEKCSMCIQMTQATILKAKKEGRAVNTDEFETACSSACTTGAMVFGDINNKEDKVASLVEDKKAFGVLDYLQTKPNVIYQVKVKNTNEA
jgi:molybdopterin-containing oxidoreductase family iron-sulfur binding subunit